MLAPPHLGEGVPFGTASLAASSCDDVGESRGLAAIARHAKEVFHVNHSGGYRPRFASSEARNAVTETARDDPERAFGIAVGIRDQWFRAQSFGWVARYARGDLARQAFDGARAAAAAGKDSYRKSAPLAWPIRAAVETQRLGLAKELFGIALSELPKVHLYCSRASAIELVLPAAFPAGPGLRAPLLALLPELCPVTSHWRSGRLHIAIAAMLASEDAAAAMAFGEALPPCKTRDRILRDLAGGMAWGPRAFFW